jgi:antirestriction protein ArdC
MAPRTASKARTARTAPADDSPKLTTQQITTKMYEEIAERFVVSLEEGTVPWQKPWAGGGMFIPRNLHRYATKLRALSNKIPLNLSSEEQIQATNQARKNALGGAVYSGVNPFLLSFTDFTSPWWVTYKQAIDLGGHVKANEKSKQRVYFWKLIIKEDSQAPKDSKKKAFPYLTSFPVFNIEQTEGLEPHLPIVEKRSALTPIEDCDLVIQEWLGKPKITDSVNGRCYYRPSTDTVSMVPQPFFDTPEHYYSTLFHELIHATGHDTRLARGIMHSDFGSYSYGKEELVAELGASFLAAWTGIDLPDLTKNAVAYLGSWLRTIKENPRMVLDAATAAGKAVDMIVGINRKDDDGTQPGPEGRLDSAPLFAD